MKKRNGGVEERGKYGFSGRGSVFFKQSAVGTVLHSKYGVEVNQEEQGQRKFFSRRGREVRDAGRS